MKELLISILVRNNEKYIPYMFKMFNNLEKNNSQKIKYLVYTNDNEDNTYNLLKEKKTCNMKIVEESLPDKIKKLSFLKRLYILRNKLLNLIKKEKFDYLLMLDSDIFINPKILEDSIRELDKKKFEAITLQTLGNLNFFYNTKFPFYFFYDTFAYVNSRGEKELENRSFKRYFFCIKNLFLDKTEEVKSSFAGFWLTKSDFLYRKNLEYIYNADNQECEHITFNKNFKLGFITNINPLRLEPNVDENFYAKTYEIINLNKTDNRGNSKIIIYLLIIIIALFIYIFIKYLL